MTLNNQVCQNTTFLYVDVILFLVKKDYFHSNKIIVRKKAMWIQQKFGTNNIFLQRYLYPWVDRETLWLK